MLIELELFGGVERLKLVGKLFDFEIVGDGGDGETLNRSACGFGLKSNCCRCCSLSGSSEESNSSPL